MPHPARLLLPLLALLTPLLLAPTASAQGVKRGDWFEDTTRVGFKMRSPKGWRFVPANMGDPIEIGRFVPENYPYINIGGSTMEVTNWLLEFDVAKLKADRKQKILDMFDAKSLEEVPESFDIEDAFPPIDLEQTVDRWVDRNALGDDWERLEVDEMKFGKAKGTEICYGGTVRTQLGTEEVRVYLALIETGQDKYVATAFNTSEKNWRKESRNFRKLAKSFTKLELEKFEFEHDGPRDFRSDKRRELAEGVQNMPGWWMHETEHYFILTDSDDEQFVEEIGDRLEAIRAVYAVDYPEDQARIADDDEDDRYGARITPLERSRLSVVRICSDRTMYSQYGGPPGSAGYWSSYHEELVIYDDKKGGGRRDTFAVLNHEAFHQYIYYFYGNLAPHSWYNEGTGDFYAGYTYNPKRKRFKLTPFAWRRDTVKGNVRKEEYVPLKELVYWSQRQYYGSNEYGLGGGANYAQGWSFIWFLRQGGGKPKGWDPAWDNILDVYLETLAETADLEAASDKAFEGVDWEAMEEAWIDYVT